MLPGGAHNASYGKASVSDATFKASIREKVSDFALDELTDGKARAQVELDHCFFDVDVSDAAGTTALGQIETYSGGSSVHAYVAFLYAGDAVEVNLSECNWHFLIACEAIQRV